MNITSERACYLLMCSALTNGTQIVSFVNPRDAKTWRYACYKMRRVLNAADNNKFKSLRFRLKSNTLIVEKKDESQSQGDLRVGRRSQR